MSKTLVLLHTQTQMTEMAARLAQAKQQIESQRVALAQMDQRYRQFLSDLLVLEPGLDRFRIEFEQPWLSNDPSREWDFDAVRTYVSRVAEANEFEELDARFNSDKVVKK